MTKKCCSRIETLEPRQLLAVYTVNSALDTHTDGMTTLREAIMVANANSGADTIQFDSSLTGSGATTIALAQGELDVNDSLTINGTGANLLAIDAQHNSRVFRIGWGTDVTVHGLTITGGGNVDAAAGIYGDTYANLTLDAVHVTGNETNRTGSYDYGGGIYGFWGSLHIIDSTIDHNKARSGGGIMYIANHDEDVLEITAQSRIMKLLTKVAAYTY